MIKMILNSSAVLVLLLLVPPPDANALALSEVKLNSSLNQPLNATIELISASPSELDSLNTYISRSRKESANNQSNWTQLTVDLVRMEKGHSYLKITSKDNMKEPVLNFLLELDWSNGRLQREYSLLLNPPQ
jgi:pilus assembly protein FimV